MTHTRIVLLGLSAVMAAAWMAASLPSLRSESPAPAAEQPPADASAKPLFDVKDVADRLDARRRTAPAPRAGRNPFEFDAPPAPPAAAPRETPAEPAAPAPPPRPIFALSGIAEHTIDGALVRTAVLSGFGQIFFAKAGDTVATRYEVTAVGADAIEMRDTVDGRVFRLGLR
jgi:hypothetical protein